MKLSIEWLLLALLPSVAICTLVDTPFGEVEGFEYITEKTIPIKVFLGIRYGKAPDVHQRFKKPELVENWAPFVHSAKRPGAACIPFAESFLAQEDNYSEDCLFLNIITPTLSGDDLPVFVFIHGGGFEVGSSNGLGFKRLAERVASEGIVAVTINYRLGPFGFFSLGDSIAPGNLGLWDQTLALHFLHEVLPHFGGDRRRITVGGHSAGAASASALQFSPHSNSLFAQAFLMSGSALTEFALSEAVVEESKKLAIELGCLKEASSVRTIDCLQERTAHEIIIAVEKIGTTRRHPNMVKFQPRMDGDFFPDAIDRLANEAPSKRSVSGVTDQESALFVLYEELSTLAGIYVNHSTGMTRDNLVHFINTVVATDHEHHDSASAFRRHLIDFYVEKDESGADDDFYLQRFTDLASDLQFLIPFYQEAQLKLANRWPTFLYVIEHSTKSFPRAHLPIDGAYHGDELEHFTDQMVLHPLKEDEDEDCEFGANLVAAIVNFVKNGDPSSSSFSWPPITKERPFQQVSITKSLRLRPEPYRSEAVKLWLDTVPKAVSGDDLRRSRLPGAAAHIVHTEL